MTQTALDTLVAKMYPTYTALVDKHGRVHLKYTQSLSGRIKQEVMTSINNIYREE